MDSRKLNEAWDPLSTIPCGTTQVTCSGSQPYQPQQQLPLFLPWNLSCCKYRLLWKIFPHSHILFQFRISSISNCRGYFWTLRPDTSAKWFSSETYLSSGIKFSRTYAISKAEICIPSCVFLELWCELHCNFLKF